MTQPKQIGRPQVKPKRASQTYLINANLPNKLQELQIARPGESISDLVNEAIIKLLKSEKL